MSHWNHRVIKHTRTSVIDKIEETETWFSIHEVYYDDAGQPNGYTQEPVEPFGETLLELADDLDRFQVALSKPVLVHEDFFPREGSLHARDIEPDAIESVRIAENEAWSNALMEIDRLNPSAEPRPEELYNSLEAGALIRPSPEALYAGLGRATISSKPEPGAEPIASLGFVIKQPNAIEPAIMCGAPVFKSFSKPRDLHEEVAQIEPGITKPCPFCQGRVLPREEWATGTWCCDAQWRIRCDQAGNP